MKSIVTSFVVFMAFVVFALNVPVHAQGSGMTDAHIASIKTNCPLALGTLGRIHVNDAPQFINSNQTYFSIGDKLMAHLNSRLTLNKYDASMLVKTASDFNNALSNYRSVYKSYEEMMSQLVRMDCQRAPVTFYDNVAAAREQRTEVHDAVVRLHELLKQYRDDVKTFRAENLEATNG